MIASLEACRLARGRCSEDDSKAGRGVGSGGGDGGDDDDDGEVFLVGGIEGVVVELMEEGLELNLIMAEEALKACRRLVR